MVKYAKSSEKKQTVSLGDPRTQFSTWFEYMNKQSHSMHISKTHIALSQMQNNALWNDLTERWHRTDTSVEILLRMNHEPSNWLFTGRDGPEMLGEE
jgi:superfamily I DNA and/or RNA helicase